MRRDHKSYMGRSSRTIFSFILISMSLINRFQESKQDLIGSSLFIRRETGSSLNREQIHISTDDWVLSLAIDTLAPTIEFYH